MHILTNLANLYSGIIASIRYGCIFLFLVQLVSTLFLSQVRISANLGDNAYLILAALLINTIAIMMFYTIIVFILKINLKNYSPEPKSKHSHGRPVLNR